MTEPSGDGFSFPVLNQPSEAPEKIPLTAFSTVTDRSGSSAEKTTPPVPLFEKPARSKVWIIPKAIRGAWEVYLSHIPNSVTWLRHPEMANGIFQLQPTFSCFLHRSRFPSRRATRKSTGCGCPSPGPT
ncbi:hypothetical protein Vafri_7194 [Volvox africanus]|uniref:Uncharacterized protein n=1 Tax=Volvox africanus TaxID=51714 RepID=A0A8J4B0D9_9CHLO|nr:hypothetical protein Vafri_7194 [Volvox africanus]